MRAEDDVVPEEPAHEATGADRPPGEIVPDPSALRPLDPRVVKAWRVGWSITAGAVGVAALFVLWLPRASPFSAAAVAGLAIVCIATALLLPPARYRAWGFQLGPTGLLVRQGVLWRTVSVVPHARIQYVDTRRGPLERALGLATVVVYTAGSRGAAVRIPGLAAADAETLRDRLAALGDADDAV